MQPPAEEQAGVDPAAVPLDTTTDPAAPCALPGGAPEASVSPAQRAGLHWWLIILVIVLDQITKAIVRSTVSLYDSVTVIPGFIDITHVRNFGVAFGLLNDLDTEFKWVVTTALGLVALVGIAYYARHLRPDERIARIGLSLILGGALGNLIDRVYAGYVLDFVDVYWGGWHFWAFNVADGSITIGALLVFVDLLLVKRHVSHPV